MASKISKFTKIFVYGTLKRGFPNHRHLTNTDVGVARFLYEGRTVLRYPLIVDQERWCIPFMLQLEGQGHRVEGEVFEVDEPMLKWLHEFEEVGDMYKVETLDVVPWSRSDQVRGEGEDDQLSLPEGHQEPVQCLCYMMLCDSNDKYLNYAMLNVYTKEHADLYAEPS